MAFTDFQQKSLQKHNELRAKHSVGPLQLDDKLCKYSLEWAEKLLKEKKMYHRPDSPYGENIFMGTGMDSVDPSRPVQAWYDEIKMYDFKNPKFAPNIGHFTQVVWKTSQKLGVAIAKKYVYEVLINNFKFNLIFEGIKPLLW